VWNFAHEICGRCEVAGSLDLSKNETPKQVCKFLKLSAPFTGPNMRDDINNVLDEGWNLNGIYIINGDDFAVFTRPKRQQ
jgi:hypothetical protein